MKILRFFQFLINNLGVTLRWRHWKMEKQGKHLIFHEQDFPSFQLFENSEKFFIHGQNQLIMKITLVDFFTLTSLWRSKRKTLQCFNFWCIFSTIPVLSKLLEIQRIFSLHGHSSVIVIEVINNANENFDFFLLTQ